MLVHTNVAKAAKGGNQPINAEAVVDTANTSTPDLTASVSNAIYYSPLSFASPTLSAIISINL